MRRRQVGTAGAFGADQQHGTQKIYLDSRMPEPIGDETTNMDKFSEERARKILAEIVREGPRPSGSYALESHAVNFVLNQLDTIKSSAHVSHRIEVDVFRPSGCFDMAFLSYFTLCYQNITNIVVRLSPSRMGDQGQRHAVMVNCHLDTMPASPAEENFMQAAHGFITQHKWRRSVRAFVNLEGAGAGGRELLFQAGPGNAWLVRTYLESAPYAHCSVLAQEIFQSGVFPSDTDFRVFRDFGHIPGLDIAYTRNGYVYHTEFDLPNFIPAGAIQRAAENSLNVVAALADSRYLAHPDAYHEGRWVFFDFLGLFTIFYSLDVGQMINGLLLVMLLVKVAYNAARASREGASTRIHYTCAEYIRAVGFHLCVFVVQAATGLTCVALVTLSGSVLVWYARPWLIAPLYVVPMALVGVAMHQWYANRAVGRLCKGRSAPSPSLTFMLSTCHSDGATGVLSLILALLTLVRVASAFYVALMVGVQLLRATVEFAMGTCFKGKRRVPAWIRLCTHLLTALPGVSMICFGVLLSYDIFVPTMGCSFNPELFIVVIALLAAYLIALFLSDLVFISDRLTPFLRLTLAAIVSLWLAMLCTRLGSVYKFEPDAPRLRRIIVLDAMRSVYKADGTLSFTDHGLWFKPMDFRGAGDLPETMISGGVTPPCDQTPDEYCDLPFYGPTAEHFHAAKSVWVPQVGHVDTGVPIQLKQESASQQGDKINMTFLVSGTDHMSLHVTSGNGWRVASWSLSDETVFSPAHRTNFVFLCSGAHIGPWNFWIQVQKDQTAKSTHTTNRLYLAVGSHNTHGPHQFSDKLRELQEAIDTRRLDSEQYGPKWAITPILGTSQLVARWF